MFRRSCAAVATTREGPKIRPGRPEPIRGPGTGVREPVVARIGVGKIECDEGQDVVLEMLEVEQSGPPR
jgi:hypothetical protein